MRLTHVIRNQQSDTLEAWVEPWCHPYRVASGSELVLRYEARSESDARIDAELTPERLVLWFGADHAPAAERDGIPAKPDWDR
ncbi:hypothetical protein E2493_17800 [Sphingomonas parva]|uniref:Uncharacterized protein n=1 Tax=Sphingomonas parva TaxID=2555898 RepID=A0A4Y8ZLN7_9SPHN|nr:hypothetical protein [Sphingomonas parva]TFI56920.1 hypothetical protein E2493_17800 [Sphingomonas parva]